MHPPNEKPMGPELELIPSFWPGTGTDSAAGDEEDRQDKTKPNQRKRKVLSKREIKRRKRQRKSAH